ncbi:hypothetical protein CC86DRAFT_446552 [Ophiobolus disseminans]|uniref:Uncharacterized protein n=1 Tax=Ophiobolus disseminans TaxID=1469910 RepID=A0A6A7A047_9PLEO|nr:hypothetical protein CC86DRAFT_446552 [Ophiobolus disseminans]
MPSSTKRTTRRSLATSIAVKNAAQMRYCDLFRRSNLPSAPVSCWEADSDTHSFSDTHSDSSVKANTNVEMSTSDDASPSVHQDSDADLDSEAEEILKDIAQLRAEGPAKPNHTPHTRKNYSRVKKESLMRSYWKRISICYMDLTRHTIDANILANWIPTLLLNRSKKEKHAMYVDDSKPLYGFIRVQISLLLLLSAATATRPRAIVESASAKGSNKLLLFKNIELMKVRSLNNPKRCTIVANVNLENIKNKDKDGKL